MKTMECRAAGEILAERYDDTGKSESAEALRDHLAVCPACAREAEEYRRAGEDLRRWTEGRVRGKDAALDLLWTRVRAGIDERRSAEGPAAETSRIRRWFWVPALAALAVLVLLFYPSDVSRSPFAPRSFDVSIEDLESDTATVALVDRGEDLPRVIWIIEDGKT